MFKYALTAAMVFGLNACGSGGGGSRSPHDDSAAESFLMDAQGLSTVDQSVRGASKADTAWTVRIQVNGSERVNLSLAPIGVVSESLKQVSLSRNDRLRFEVTVSDASNAETVYGTNLAEVAQATPLSADTWNQECAPHVTPDIDLSSQTLVKDEDGRVSIQVNICDFVGFSLKPLVEIKPQPKLVEKKTVIYQCSFKPTVATRNLYRLDNQSCTYGYAPLAGETALVISILKDYAPGSALYNDNAPVMDKFDLELGNGGLPRLETRFLKPAFGSNAACHTQKVDVKYAVNGAVKTARLTFNRFTDEAGDEVWAPQDSASWPTLDQLESYYRNASNETMTLYRECEWIPEATDVAASSVIQFAAQ